MHFEQTRTKDDAAAAGGASGGGKTVDLHGGKKVRRLLRPTRHCPLLRTAYPWNIHRCVSNCEDCGDCGDCGNYGDYGDYGDVFIVRLVASGRRVVSWSGEHCANNYH